MGQKLANFYLRKKSLVLRFLVATVVATVVLTLSSNPGSFGPFPLRNNVLKIERSIFSPMLGKMMEAHKTEIRTLIWVVVTSISHPTEQIGKLAKIPMSTVVVVADTKTPTNWSYPNVIFLGVKEQERLGYNILNHVPWNSYTRKMIGYLYAIQNGAKAIYDTDDDNAPDHPEQFYSGFDFREISAGLVPSVLGTVNPYAHFGRPDIWPRGYPLEEIGSNHSSWYTSCRLRTPVIQQGLVNGDPDVDAIYRLTRKKHYQNLNVKFDPVAPPTVFGSGTISPYNSQNTVIHYDGFWSLMLPVSVAFRVTDIWRSYWAQPLLWKTGNFLGFYAAHTTQRRNAHNFLKDFVEEDKIYKQGRELASFIGGWSADNCNDHGTTFSTCLVKLSKDMANSGFWEDEDHKLAEAWVKDLESVGYEMPKIVRESPISLCIPNHPNSTVRFKGRRVDVDETERPSFPMSSFKPLQNFCKHRLPEQPESSRFLRNHGSYNKTLLVVTYNFPHFNNIYFLDLVYRPYFPNIIYCGDAKNGTEEINDLLTREEFKRLGVTSFSFLNASVENGYFAYSCALRAIDMNYAVEDYVIMSDDVLFRFWKTKDFPLDNMWYFGQSKVLLNTVKLGLEGNPMSWNWWETGLGRNATKDALKEIETLAEKNADSWAAKFLESRASQGLNSSVTRYGSGDFVRVPKSKLECFSEAGWVFLKNRVFLEIAVPLLRSGCDGGAREVPGTWTWGGERSNPFEAFNLDKGIVFHPVKFNQVLEIEGLRKDFCECFLSDIVSI